jgi:lipoyl(octanoyl) transferase
MNLWLLIHSGKCGAAFNMAQDEALLEAMTRLQKPVLRFYGWQEPAATFGYFQNFIEVGKTTRLRPLIRRPTGGGIVPHDADWTYSFAVPPGHEWHALKAEESYHRIHEWIRRAFEKLNVPTELAPFRKVALPGQCFAGHEKSDLLWHGKKIAGAAQRRNKLGLLIQGSIQPPPVGLSRLDWETAMTEIAREQFAVQWQELAADPELHRRTEELLAQKYSQSSYNQKR